MSWTDGNLNIFLCNFFLPWNVFYLLMCTRVGIMKRWITCSRVPLWEVFKELTKYSVLHCRVFLEETVCLIKWSMKSEFVKSEDLLLCVLKDLLLDFVVSLLNPVCYYIPDILILSFLRSCSSLSMHAYV